jgi:hypothetical protein
MRIPGHFHHSETVGERARKANKSRQSDTKVAIPMDIAGNIIRTQTGRTSKNLIAEYLFHSFRNMSPFNIHGSETE